MTDKSIVYLAAAVTMVAILASSAAYGRYPQYVDAGMIILVLLLGALAVFLARRGKTA
jgi:hypothetical protein